tara:strand:+ start:828 stop:2036 length:1209 start_codon:yes stop_codon:yes gene_type:complete
MSFELRDYQEKFSKQGYEILKKHSCLILNMEVRTGKSHTVLDIGVNYKDVLFVTKKKAIQSVLDDYETAGHSYNLLVINYESLHKVTGSFDLVICDESNEKISAYPKPTLNAKRVKHFVSNHLILLTGTLLPESNSQIYHQLWVSKFSPFKEFKNFYSFHKKLGIKKILYTSYGQANDYSDVPYSNIEKYIDPIKISYTQKEAGFKASIKEIIHTVKLKPQTIDLMNRLKKDLVIEGDTEVVLADTSVKLMSKLHQLSSGTIKFESGESMILDTSKIDYVKDKFKGKKIAIYYKFKAELDLIANAFDLANDIEEFDCTDKNIAFQFVSGRSGIKLDKADCIIAINIDFSATTYYQFRARMITSTSLRSDIHWIFSDAGFERKVLKSVEKKKNFTTQTFKNNG